MRLPSIAAAVASALTLAACASTPTPRPTTAPPTVAETPTAPSPSASAERPPAVVPLSELAGWDEDDHLAAFEAYRTGCRADKDLVAAAVCARAGAAGRLDDAGARRFLETHFRAEVGGGDGLLTAYFAPEYAARTRPSAEFSAPVRPKPADLQAARGGQPAAYADRAAIEARPADDALAWMRPEDLFFLQIQGSGLLTFEDGRRLRAAFAGHNGQPYVGIAAPMRPRGLLADQNTSGDAIRSWLAAHRGPEADAVMALNPRYVFFQLAEDDGREAVGAAGSPLPAGRAIAVDLSQHALGGLYWIDAEAPKLAGAFPAYRRAVMALDTGGAIKGAVRADLYIGTGEAAGTEAGRVRHTLRLYRLLPQF